MAVGWVSHDVQRLWLVVCKGQSSLEDLAQWLWEKSFNWAGFPERAMLSPGLRALEIIFSFGIICLAGY